MNQITVAVGNSYTKKKIMWKVFIVFAPMTQINEGKYFADETSPFLRSLKTLIDTKLLR